MNHEFPLGIELWRSQVASKERAKKSELLGYAFILLFLPPVTLIILAAVGFFAWLQIYVGTQIILGPWGIFFAWFAWQFDRAYLVIFEGGITVQRPFRGFKPHVYSWKNIIQVTSYGIGRFNILLSGLTIFIKDRRPIRLDSKFIGGPSVPLGLIRKHVPIPEQPMSCTICRSDALDRSCPACGASRCSICSETFECVACHFHRLNRLAIIAFTLGIIPFLLMVIAYFLDPTITFTSFLTADLGYPSQSATSLLRSYYGVSHLACSIIAIPYGIATLAANKNRYKYLKKVKWNGYSVVFFIALGLAALVLFSDFSYFVQAMIAQRDVYVGTSIAGAGIDVFFALFMMKLGLGRFNASKEMKL